jgi:hypothetical protein
LWWCCYDTGLIRRVESVHCGLRDSLPDAERDARKWAELPGQDAPHFDFAAIGTFDEFDALVGEGFVTYTLCVAPDPIEAPALDLWNFDDDDRRAVALEPAGSRSAIPFASLLIAAGENPKAVGPMNRPLSEPETTRDDRASGVDKRNFA